MPGIWLFFAWVLALPCSATVAFLRFSNDTWRRWGLIVCECALAQWQQGDQPCAGTGNQPWSARRLLAGAGGPPAQAGAGGRPHGRLRPAAFARSASAAWSWISSRWCAPCSNLCISWSYSFPCIGGPVLLCSDCVQFGLPAGVAYSHGLHAACILHLDLLDQAFTLDCSRSEKSEISTPAVIRVYQLADFPGH